MDDLSARIKEYEWERVHVVRVVIHLNDRNFLPTGVTVSDLEIHMWASGFYIENCACFNIILTILVV